MEKNQQKDTYSDAFCKVYNEFGWNYFPLAFGEQLLVWMEKRHFMPKTAIDLACGPGVLCDFLSQHGIEASGMDFSKGMIDLAKERNPKLFFEVADMITYCPAQQYDLVTCTGDALNHITDLNNIEKIFRNVYQYLSDDGYFIFDILDQGEVALDEPIDLDWSDSVKAQFMITRNEKDVITLEVSVYENGKKEFAEQIHEIVHDPQEICTLLQKSGFRIVQCDRQLLEDQPARGMKWFVIAGK